VAAPQSPAIPAPPLDPPSTDPGDPGEPPPDPPRRPPELDLLLRVEGQSLRTLLRTRKLVVTARVGRAAKLALAGRARLAVPAPRNARTKLVRVFKVKRAHFAEPSKRRVRLKLSKRGRRALSRLDRVRLVIVGTATAVGGDRVRTRVVLTLRR
jgi:hypothetical protein